jgi:hypothetical protein
MCFISHVKATKSSNVIFILKSGAELCTWVWEHVPAQSFEDFFWYTIYVDTYQLISLHQLSPNKKFLCESKICASLIHYP